MSQASPYPQPAGSMYTSNAHSHNYIDQKSPANMVDPQDLERRLRVLRNLTPHVADCVDKWKAVSQQAYDHIIALGGRPTRPIKQYPDYKTPVKDGMVHYRNDYEKFEFIFEVDNCRASSHWADESNHWDAELWRWQKFKEAQKVHNQHGRSELELELENTDAALVESLSKLNDWQEFQFIHQKRVHEAEEIHQNCQQGNARSHGAMVVATKADEMLTIEEPTQGWMSYLMEAQKELEASRKELTWVMSQWPEVIVEACSSILAAPQLQKQLEVKLETQTKAIYRALEQEGARPSHTVCAPSANAEPPERIQHWISEGSAFTAELWDWRIFMAFRRGVRNSGNIDQVGRKILSRGDSCSELYEDLVKYQQHGLDKAASWASCWRRQATQYTEAKKSASTHKPPTWPIYGDVDTDDDYSDGGNDVAEARQAEKFAVQAEEKVSLAASRLERSKEKLQRILAECGSPSTSEIPAARLETQPTPTSSTSNPPEIFSETRRQREKKGSAGTAHRRLKKERLRKKKSEMMSTQTEQQALPTISLGSSHLNGDDDDGIDMSNDAEDLSVVKPMNERKPVTEDRVMSDIKGCPYEMPSPAPQSYSTPTSNMKYKQLPSPNSQNSTSGKTRSTTKLDQVHSGKILKKSGNNKPQPKVKALTEEQKLALLKAASTGCPSTHSPSLNESEPRTPSKPTTSTNNTMLPSPSSQSPGPKKTRPAAKPNQTPSSKILKKSSKEKPLKKAKAFTEQEKAALLNAASPSRPCTIPTPLRRSQRLEEKNHRH